MWPNLQSPSRPRALCLLLLVLSANPKVHCQIDLSNVRTSSTTPSPASPTNPTCASRTINYITHSLPQQCLTSYPSPATSAPSTVAVDPASISSTVTETKTHHTSSSVDSATVVAAAPQEEEVKEEDEEDEDDHAFPSFEEWKAMMLADSDQVVGEAKQRKPQDGDALGDIAAMADDPNGASIDFDPYSDKISELTSGAKPLEKGKKDGTEDQQNKDLVYDDGLARVHLSKDAGQTCRERFSYSSFDAGATVKKTSPGTKNPRAILTENKDSYLLFECSNDNKFFIVELSDLILVDTVVIANFEFFSSMVRQFRVSVSDRYPVKLDKWVDLGTYGARNSRDIQPFLVENPRIWARFLRIEVLSHYGNEYYCPLSLLRVHGLRMMDSWKTDPADGEIEEEHTRLEATYEVDEPVEEFIEEADDEQSHVEDQILLWEQSEWIPYWDKSYFVISFPLSAMSPVNGSDDMAPDEGDVNRNSLPGTPSTTTTEQKQQQDLSTTTPADTASEASTPSSPAQFTTTPQHSITAPPPVGIVSSQPTAKTAERTSNSGGSSSTPTSMRPSQGTKSPSSSSSSFTPPPSVQKTPAYSSSKSKSSAQTSMKPPNSKSTAAKPSSGSSSLSASRNKTATSTTSSAAPSPTVQDSFFKALSKRIQTLESNTTLSLQYIESQSRFLQEALAKLEKRQVAKVDMFLDALNRTVLSEIRELRTQYDYIWQSTVIALETQREQTEREVVALSSRLGVMADEVVFQKRMAIVQSVLLLICLILVIFTRGFAGGVEAYYPSQFLPSSSRVASPMYPSSPKRSLPSLKIPDNDSPVQVNGDGRVYNTSRSVQHRPSSLYSVGEEPSPQDHDISLSHKRSIASLRAEAIASGASFPIDGQLNGRHGVVKRSSSTILLDPNNPSQGTTAEPALSHYASNSALSSGISNGYDGNEVATNLIETYSSSLPSASPSASVASAVIPHPAVVHHRRPSPPPRALSDSALFQYDGDDLVDVNCANQPHPRPAFNHVVNGTGAYEDHHSQQKPARPHLHHPHPRQADSISSGFANSSPSQSSPLAMYDRSYYSPAPADGTGLPSPQSQSSDYFPDTSGQRSSVPNGRNTGHHDHNILPNSTAVAATSTGPAAAAAIRSSLAHSSSSSSFLSTASTTSTTRKPLPALPEDADG